MEWYERPTLPMDECIDREVYEINSRNLVVGVWNAGTNGFIGIREKFGDEFLFTEYHYDTGPPFGTARPYVSLGTLPEGIELREYNAPSCAECGREAVFLPDDPNTRVPGKNYHEDDRTLVCTYAGMTGYAPLFDFLKPLHDQIVKRYDD